MVIKKTLARFLAVLLLSGFGVAVVATPANAAWSDCQFGQVCTWMNPGGNGTMYYYTSPGPGACVNLGPGWNDAVRGISNKSSVPTYWYRDGNCTGTYAAPCCHPIYIPANYQEGWTFSQGFSSFRWNHE